MSQEILVILVRAKRAAELKQTSWVREELGEVNQPLGSKAHP